jgi:DnaJ-class molecular chaperone
MRELIQAGPLLYVRCEPCDGVGDVVVDAPESPEGFVKAICPECHGNGFVRYDPALHGEARVA